MPAIQTQLSKAGLGDRLLEGRSEVVQLSWAGETEHSPSLRTRTRVLDSGMLLNLPRDLARALVGTATAVWA